jgi:hypothetical protein
MANRCDLTDFRAGRLVVLGDSGNRAKSGDILWVCMCDCGNLHLAAKGNLTARSVQSCGCLARELSSLRMRSAARPAQRCRHESCEHTTEKGGLGYCGMHAQRLRRWGDPAYVTPEEIRRANNREAQRQRFPTVKPSTYRKLFGRHEHRVVAQDMVGRPLRTDEHVHHLDENKHNNAPENLAVMSAREHLALHAKQRRNEK